MTKCLNRRQRRLPKTAASSPKLGKCRCDTCFGGTSWPPHYMMRVNVRRRGRRKVIGKTSISYECYVERDPRLLRQSPRYGTNDTTESASAEGGRWLENMKAGGLGVDLHEVALPTEDVDELSDELNRAESLLRHLAAQGLTKGQQAERLRRFYDLTAKFARDPYRLAQWLYVEFPGWLSL